MAKIHPQPEICCRPCRTFIQRGFMAGESPAAIDSGTVRRFYPGQIKHDAFPDQKRQPIDSIQPRPS